MKRAAIITSSDSGYRGEREDLSGPAIREILEREGYQVVSLDILPDDREILKNKMAEIADQGLADPYYRRHRLFGERCNAGSDRGYYRAKSSGNPGGYACLQHDYYKESNAEQGFGRNPQKNTYHQSSRKSKGSTGKSGIYY